MLEGATNVGILSICEGSFGLCWPDLQVDDDDVLIDTAKTLSRPHMHTTKCSLGLRN
ncbi:hypothetical protein MTR_3g087200 [Medicago truncatula]|uniref:Uncharacterized protein n=1 Tax=Medicago truncatula TaxID=3880 RepID=G7J3R7_MEDTR|nr:hypothetical protein MTR_3g087200 [Medicago truncatula]